jgi:hypothetical protein
LLLVLVKSLMIAGVAVLPLPALVLGARRLLSRRGYAAFTPDDRAGHAVMIVLRVLVLLLVFALSGITLLSLIGAMVKDVSMPGLVYVFFVLDLLLAVIVLLTFGRRDPRSARRRASPAAR